MRARLLLPLLILALAWGQELIDQLLFAGQWNLPMGPDQPWWGVITAPFSHAGFGHLISNSLAFLPLSWLVLSRGMRDYLSVWLSVLLINIPVAMFWQARSHGWRRMEAVAGGHRRACPNLARLCCTHRCRLC